MGACRQRDTVQRRDDEGGRFNHRLGVPQAGMCHSAFFGHAAAEGNRCQLRYTSVFRRQVSRSGHSDNRRHSAPEKFTGRVLRAKQVHHTQVKQQPEQEKLPKPCCQPVLC